MQAGELRTKIRIQRPETTGLGVNQHTEWIDLGNTTTTDPPRYTWAKWTGSYGSEALLADSLQAQQPGTVVIRYRPDVTEQCRILKDGIVYHVISPNDLFQQHLWLEFKVKASVNG